MKKMILSIIMLLTLTVVHAQQTVVIQRPGILTDLAEAATALVTLPAAAAVGFVSGTVEAVRDVTIGSTTVITTSAPVVTPAPVVAAPVVVTSPVVVTPAAPAVVVTPAPRIAPTTTIVTNYGDGTTITVTRPASAYELGPNVVIPVDPAHRVGPSPFVNPYVYRHR